MRCLTYGVFDLFHIGHLMVLKKAGKLGDLVIGVYSDKVAESFKRKPIIGQDERMRLIEELYLGEVFLLDEFTPSSQLLKDKKIDLVAKAVGAGWTKESQPQWEGVRTVLLPYTDGVSTSEIIKRVKCLNY